MSWWFLHVLDPFVKINQHVTVYVFNLSKIIVKLGGKFCRWFDVQVDEYMTYCSCSLSNILIPTQQGTTKAYILLLYYRERIVHALAAKPNVFDTPQLLAKFKSEGLNTTEHLKEIHDTLTLVGLPNGKRCWALRPEYFGEVDVNWSFYSETDKQLVKRWVCCLLIPVFHCHFWVAVFPNHICF